MVRHAAREATILEVVFRSTLYAPPLRGNAVQASPYMMKASYSDAGQSKHAAVHVAIEEEHTADKQQTYWRQLSRSSRAEANGIQNRRRQVVSSDGLRREEGGEGMRVHVSLRRSIAYCRRELRQQVPVLATTVWALVVIGAELERSG